MFFDDQTYFDKLLLLREKLQAIQNTPQKKEVFDLFVDFNEDFIYIGKKETSFSEDLNEIIHFEADLFTDYQAAIEKNGHMKPKGGHRECTRILDQYINKVC